MYYISNVMNVYVCIGNRQYHIISYIHHTNHIDKYTYIYIQYILYFDYIYICKYQVCIDIVYTYIYIYTFVQVSINGVLPIAGWFTMGSSIKMDDLGVPLLIWETSV